MKRSLLALAVLGAFASAASAQSSVTLSGMLDAGVRHKGTNTGYDWSLAGAGSAFNNFTLSGREDLGGGMYAFFALNHRFAIQNGTTSTADYGIGTSLPLCVAPATPAGGTCSSSPPVSQPTFWRNAAVGLGGGFGDIRLGRIIMPLQDMNGGFDPWYGGYTVASTHTGGITATVRANSAIYYRSPSMGGLKVEAAIASGQGQLPAETANNFGSTAPALVPAFGYAGQRPLGFSVRYAAGPLNVGVAYDRNYANFKTTGLYGSYDFGAFKLYGQYENGDGTNGGSLATKEKIKAFSISADIPMGAFVGKVGYLRYDSNITGKDANKFGFGAEYKFSKRTLVYSDIGKASGDRLSVGDKKSQFDIGLRHAF
jgi:predicted porin